MKKYQHNMVIQTIRQYRSKALILQTVVRLELSQFGTGQVGDYGGISEIYRLDNGDHPIDKGAQRKLGAHKTPDL